MAKKQAYRLTNLELAVMEILWDAERPLSRTEVLDAGVDEQGEPLFAASSFHLLINNLIDLNYILVINGAGKNENYGRLYTPNVTRAEHFARQITSASRFTPADIPAIICSLFHYSDVKDTDAVLKDVAEMMEKRK